MTAPEKLLQHPQALCNMVRRVALAAGHLLLDYADRMDMNATTKDDGSPVTAADHAAEALIMAELASILPGVPVVAEEETAAGRVPDIAGVEYFWLVDALDGTRAFVRGEHDFTVNIALIRNAAPLLGVVYAPARGEMYSGCGPDTALRWLEDTDHEKSIRLRRPPASGLVVMASSHHGDKARMDEFLSQYKVAKMVRQSSSLKLCALAAGKADMYPRFGPTCEWDIAAGDAVLRAAGAAVHDLSGVPLCYGRMADKFVNPDFVACSVDLINLDAQAD